ncbi:MAG TPA: hypothetical protein VD994_03565 [Prosthecobacter sp.]|nr:hypothetical protein [Prosthecobacter sp.]
MNKPRFDPSKPFEEVGQKPKFDPAQPFEAEQPSTMEAVARGGAQGLSLGFADEATGLIEAILDSVRGKTSVIEGDFGDRYRSNRDESRAAYEEAETAHPVAFGASRTAGAVLPAVAATVATKGAATPLALRALAPTTAKGLATLAATEGLGASEADLTEGELDEAARDMALSGLMGYGAAKAMPMVGSALKRGTKAAAEGLHDSADFMASKAVGLTKALRKKFRLDPEDTRAIGRTALDTGIITPLADAADMKARAETLKELSGSRIGEIREGLDVAKVNRPQASRMMTELAEKGAPYIDVAGARGLQRQYKMAMMDLARYQTEPTFENLQKLKNVYKGLAFPKGVLAEEKTGFVDAYHIIKRELETSIKEGVDIMAKNTEKALPENVRSLHRIPEIYDLAKEDYGAAKTMIKGLDDRLAAEEGNRLIRPTDFITAGGVGLGTGSLPITLASVAAKRGVEKYGFQTGSFAAHNLAKMLDQAPQAFGKYAQVLQAAHARGAQSLASTHYVLQQKDPAYREMVIQMSTAGAE